MHGVVDGENNRMVTMHTSNIRQGDWCKNFTLRELQQTSRPFEKKKNGMKFEKQL